MFEISFKDSDDNLRILELVIFSTYDIFTTAAHLAHKRGATSDSRLAVRHMHTNQTVGLKMSDFGY